MRKVEIRKYQADDEYVVFFHGKEKEIKMLTSTFDLLGLSVKDRNKTSVTLRGTMDNPTFLPIRNAYSI